jgi:hypothetical protein
VRVLIVDSYYRAFLDKLYSLKPELAGASYAVQRASLLGSFFGTSDFYSANLNANGHPATEVIYTCEPAQAQWAREHGLPVPSSGAPIRGYSRLPWFFQARERDRARILAAQVEEFGADVVHFQDPVGTPAQVVAAVRKVARAVTAQVASHVPHFGSMRHFDLMLTSFPHYVERFRRAGVRSEYFNLGFEPRVLERLQRGDKHDVVFVGGLSPRHAARTEWLEAIARAVPLKWWGYGVESLSPNSPLRRMHQGEAWGLDMYNIFYNSRIVLNHHIDEAEDNANNMRLYEATGTGAMLLTDAKKNLGDLFVPDREVVAYNDAADCAEKVRYFLAHEDERAAIALGGQQRTLSSHTYLRRMEQFVRMLTPLLA